MEYKASEIKAGIFIFISLVAFMAFLVIILGLNKMQETEIYRTRLEYVGGIEKGSQVRYAGLQVGQVTDIYLTHDDYPGVELTLEIAKGTPIRTDSYAFMTTIGLMGSLYIEITAGSPEKPVLKPGALIPSENVTGFAQMSGTATEATEELTELLRRLNDAMNIQNRANLGKMLQAMTEITENTDKEMHTLLNNLNQVSSNLNGTIEQVNTLLAQNDTLINNSFQGMETLIDNSNQTMTKVSDLLDEMDYQVSNRSQEYMEIMDHLNNLTRNLETLSQTLKEQPWQLVRKQKAPERELP